MANPGTAFGFRNPQGKAAGVTGRLEKFTATAEIFKGDPVSLNATGGATRLADATPSSVVPDGIASHHAAANASVLVYTNLGELTFEIMHDGTPASTNTVGQTHRLTTAAGDSTTKLSGTTLDTSDTANAAAQCRITSMVTRPDNDNALANPVNRVEFVKWGKAPAAS